MPTTPRQARRQASETDLSGMTFAVTGASRGIGYFAAEELARRGAHVILLGRDLPRLNTALISITEQVPDASTSRILLDLTSSASIADAAASLNARPRLDGLLLNAALVAPLTARQETEAGAELTMATNHLGHFELTSLVIDSLAASATGARAPRVVAIGSTATRIYPFDLEDWQSSFLYDPRRAYAASKHAVEIFGFELDRRLRAAAVPVEAIVVDPGVAVDGSAPIRTGLNEPSSWKRFAARLSSPLSHGKHRAASIAVHALTDPGLSGGDYIGPARGTRGAASKVDAPSTQRDTERAATLWRLSEEATRAEFSLVGAAR